MFVVESKNIDKMSGDYIVAMTHEAATRKYLSRGGLFLRKTPYYDLCKLNLQDARKFCKFVNIVHGKNKNYDPILEFVVKYIK